MKTFYWLLSLLILSGFNLKAQNTAPVAVPDTVSVVAEDTVTIFPLQNDYDPDGDAFHIHHVYNARHGDREYNDTLITYHSDSFYGNDSLQYKIEDDGTPPLHSDRTTIYINVAENPNLPTAVNDTFTVYAQKPTVLNLLVNDFDPNGDSLKIREVVHSVGGSITDITDSTVTLATHYSNGWRATIDYTSEKKGTGKRYFSNEAEATVFILPNPDLPVAVNDETEAATFVDTEFNPLHNDTDPFNYSLKIYKVYGTESTTVEVVSDTLLKIRTSNFSGTDTIRYYVQETNAPYGYISASAKIAVHAVDNPDIPVAVADAASAGFNTPVSINVLQNDFSPTGEPLKIDEVDGNDNVTATIHDSLIELTNVFPPFSYDDSIHQITVSYRVKEKNNPDVFSKWGDINLTVSRDNSLPMGVNDFATATGGLPITVNVLQNDINNTQDSLILKQKGLKSIVSTQNSFSIVLNDSTIEYHAFGDFHGVDTVQYFIFKKGSGEWDQPVSYGYLIVNVDNSRFYKTLDINNIKAGINGNGYLFNNYGFPGNDYYHSISSREYVPAFEAPKGSGINAIFCSSLWIAGNDDFNNSTSLHAAAVRYPLSSGTDFWYGPVADNYNKQYDEKYIGVWKLTKYDIKYHMNHYQDAGYKPKIEITTWPGNGDVANGEAAQLAPYFDKNNNGIYEPMAGDYPLIRGDQAIYFIFNDDRTFHTGTQGKPLGIEIHGMAYEFNDESDSALWNTVFVHYDLINRSDTTYYDTYFGNFVDSDLGNPYDDYVGSNVRLGAMIEYNGDGFDEDVTSSGGNFFAGYGDKLPAVGITMLGGPFMDADNSDNPSGGCDESINGLNFGNGIVDDERWGMQYFGYMNNGGGPFQDPYIAPHYYNMLQGNYITGTHWSFVKDGNTINFNYWFPGNSDTCNYGTGGVDMGFNPTEENSNNGHPNPPGDRRGVLSTGPITFKPGDVQQLDMAYVFARSYDSSDPVDIVTNRIITVRDKAIVDSLMVLPDEIDGIAGNNASAQLINIWPNPAHNAISIDCRALKGAVYYKVYTVTGVMVGSGNLMGNSINRLPLNNYEEGIYIIHLKTDKGYYYGKFVKQ